MKTDYAVGYGRPPKHAQWKKGQSGNPAGRRRRPENAAALVATLLSQRVVVRKGKTTVRRSRMEHLLHRLIEKAIAGDPRLMKMALDEMRRHEACAAGEAPAETNAADAEVIQALTARLMRDAAHRVASER
jgi:hypothetical protein